MNRKQLGRSIGGLYYDGHTDGHFSAASSMTLAQLGIVIVR